MPKRKDLPFFGSDIAHTYEGAYRDLAEYEAAVGAAPLGALCGEASVQYLFSARAPEEIRKYSPQAKIIIMLRDPVEMIYALHSHNLWMKEEDITNFSEALMAEPQRRNDEHVPRGNHWKQGLLYRDLGHLYPYVARYLDAFGKDRVHIIAFDEFIADTDRVTRLVLSFLGLTSDIALDLKVVNPNKKARSGALLRFTQRPHPAGEAIFKRIAPRQLHGKVIPWLGRRNANEMPRPAIDPVLARSLREEFAQDIIGLSQLQEQAVGASELVTKGHLHDEHCRGSAGGQECAYR